MAVTRQQDSRSNRKSPAPDRNANSLAAQNFARGLASEFRRITWPSRPEWIAATILTLVLVIGIGLFTFGVDQLCSWLFGLIHH
jgi:preprotein translocase SecE subunit